MIGLIKGQIVHLSSPSVLVMTASGVGYDIEVPLPCFYTLSTGADILLFTHLQVREDAQSLFGFLDKKECDLFKKLLKINGVGAKMALAILSTLSAHELALAVAQNNDTALTKVAGVGKKTAQRLIIELNGKLDEFGLPDLKSDVATQSTTHTPPMLVIAEVESALISLGYKDKEAQLAIKNAQLNLNELTTATLLKASLKLLSTF